MVRGFHVIAAIINLTARRIGTGLQLTVETEATYQVVPTIGADLMHIRQVHTEYVPKHLLPSSFR